MGDLGTGSHGRCQADIIHCFRKWLPWQPKPFTVVDTGVVTSLALSKRLQGKQL